MADSNPTPTEEPQLSHRLKLTLPGSLETLEDRKQTLNENTSDPADMLGETSLDVEIVDRDNEVIHQQLIFGTPPPSNASGERADTITNPTTAGTSDGEPNVVAGETSRIPEPVTVSKTLNGQVSFSGELKLHVIRGGTLLDAIRRSCLWICEHFKEAFPQRQITFHSMILDGGDAIGINTIREADGVGALAGYISIDDKRSYGVRHLVDVWDSGDGKAFLHVLMQHLRLKHGTAFDTGTNPVQTAQDGPVDDTVNSIDHDGLIATLKHKAEAGRPDAKRRIALLEMHREKPQSIEDEYYEAIVQRLFAERNIVASLANVRDDLKLFKIPHRPRQK